MANDRVTVDLTTGIGIVSFPHLTQAQADKNKNDKGEPVFDLQFLIPKSDRESARAVLAAIKKVGEAKWGANWKKVRSPLRDGDAEKDELTEDGSTKGDKYPERLGHYFINARSKRPVGVVDRQRQALLGEDDIYGGCKAKINVTFYPYSQAGNHGIGVALNGVQKIADGESFGSGRPSVESMFDLLEDDGLDLDETEDEIDEPAPAKKAPAKRAAKKAPAKKAPEPVEEDEFDEDDDLLDDLDDDM